MVVGDSVRWAEPTGDFQSMMPAIPLLWASFGIVRPPATDAVTFGATSADAAGLPRTTWRFTRGSDTLEYVALVQKGRKLLAEWRLRGRTIAHSRLQYDSLAKPAAARIDFPEASARFEFTVLGIDSGAAAVLPPALWRSRR